MRNGPKIIVLKKQTETMAYEEKILQPLSPRLIAGDHNLRENEIIALTRDADAVLNSGINLSSCIIEQMDRCKIIVCYGKGTVDTASALEKRIRVKIIPEPQHKEMAEQLLNLVLTLWRKGPNGDGARSRLDTSDASQRSIEDLKGMTLGIYGDPGIAHELSGPAVDLGIEIWNCPQNGASSNSRIKNVNLYHLIRKSDFLSIHAPFSLESPCKFREREFRLMKPGSYFINATDSVLVDEKALASALARGQVAGAALHASAIDQCKTGIFLQERDDKVILTSHPPDTLRNPSQSSRESATREILRALNPSPSTTRDIEPVLLGKEVRHSSPNPSTESAKNSVRLAKEKNNSRPPFTAAEFVVRYLEKMGVKQIFGVAGGTTSPLYEAVNRSSIQDIATRHESGAASMAAGYARLSGKLGVCLATTGVYTTNLITGVASAYADSIPILVITGQVPTDHFGKGASLESSPEGMDIVQMLKHVTRYSGLAYKAKKVPELLQKAVTFALLGRTGPVHLSLPNDILRIEIMNSPEIWHWPEKTPGLFDRNSVKEAAGWLSRAENPVILAGHGCVLADACDEVAQLSESLGIPVATTPMAKGALPEDNPFSLGIFGLSGSPLAEHFLMSDQVDVMLAVGTSFNEWGTLGRKKEFMPSQALLHVNIDPFDIGRNYPAKVSLCGDAKVILKELFFEIQRQRKLSVSCSPVVPESLFKARKKFGIIRNPSAMKSDSLPLKPQRLMGDLRASIPDNAIVFVDGGATRSWATHYFQTRAPKTYFPATGMASTGYGVAGAIGAKFAFPNRIVISIIGDGGFLRNSMEVSTAVAYKKQVIWIVLNDGRYGMIDYGDRIFGYSAISTQYPICDIAKVASGLGAHSIYIRNPGEINKNLIQNIIENGEPTVLDVRIDPNEVPHIRGRVSSVKEGFSEKQEELY